VCTKSQPKSFYLVTRKESIKNKESKENINKGREDLMWVQNQAQKLLAQTQQKKPT